jgi:hypothetical protein
MVGLVMGVVYYSPTNHKLLPKPLLLDSTCTTWECTSIWWNSYPGLELLKKK